MLRIEYSPTESSFQRKLTHVQKKYEAYRAKIHTMPFANLPWRDFEHIKKVKFEGKIEEIFLVGMGGSSLGAQVLTSIFPGYQRVTFLDNIEPDFVSAKLSYYRNPGFILSSKSGETMEVMALAKILFKKFKNHKKFLVITDEQKSALGQFARKKKIPVVFGAKNIPGRFSVFSESGLIPYFLSSPSGRSLEIKDLLSGAKGTSWKKAFDLACHQYLNFQASKNIVVLFSYCERMDSFLDWYVQLLSESIGKSRGVGITPVKAVGVKDQHAQLQLFLDGPRDKFFIFLKHDGNYQDLSVPGEKYSLENLFDAEYEGVKKVFRKKEIPFAELRFEKIFPEMLGELLFFFELEVAFLGSLLKINFQNQPAVEMNKRYTNMFLKKD